MRSIKSLAIGAGFGFVTLAIFVQGFLPAILPESRTKRVSRAVRTDLGDVKWVRYESSDYTPLEKLGRAVYIREGCWYCHSQYVRPVAGEELRWGPVSEAGEYAFDLPHLLSTRRIGPDLTRVGSNTATTGTTRITGIRAWWCRTRSCRASSGSTRGGALPCDAPTRGRRSRPR